MIKTHMIAAALAGMVAYAPVAGLAAGVMLADRHVQKGMQCVVCHGPDMAKPEPVSMDTCTNCHPVKALVSKTASVKPTNPHTSPHYADELECSNCHMGHSAPENFCNQCHQFNFVVP